MSLLDNKPLLLTIAAVLLVLKFVFMPILAWQSEQVETISQQEEQLSKGLLLLDNQVQHKEALAELKLLSQQQMGMIASDAKSTIDYQLEVKKMIDKLFEKNDLKVRSSNWLTPIIRSKIEENRLEVSLSGDFKKLIELMLLLEKQQPKLAFTELRTNISKMYPAQKKLGRFTGKLVLVGWRNIEGNINE